MMVEDEKLKMLRNADYNYIDATSTNERQHGAIALDRYNNVCHTASGPGGTARELLKMVVKPANDKMHSFIVPCIHPPYHIR